MDPSEKLVYTRNQEVLSANLQILQDDTTPKSTYILIMLLIHLPNGQFC